MAARWHMLAVLTFAHTAMGFQFQSVAALGTRLTGDLGLSHAALGLLIRLCLLPGLALAVPAGWLGQRFGDRRLTLLGLALMTAGGGILGLSEQPGPMMAGRLVSGAGAVLLNVLVTKMVADWFAGREIVPAMGLLITSWPLGIALAMVALPPLTAGQSIGAAALIAALPALAALVLVALIYRSPPGLGRAGIRSRGLDRAGILRALLAGAVWTFYNAGPITVLAFTADLLVVQGRPVAAATATVSLVGWLIIPSLGLGGWLSADVARPTATFLICLAIAAVTILMLPAGVAALPALIVIGLVLGPPAPLIMSLPVEAVPAEARGMAMGPYFTRYYVGMALASPIAGGLRDVTGQAAAPIWVAASCLGLAAAALLAFRAAQARPSV